MVARGSTLGWQAASVLVESWRHAGGARRAFSSLSGDLLRAAGPAGQLRSLLHQVSTPVLVTGGDADPYRPASAQNVVALEAGQDGARLVQGAGHLAPLECPAGTAGILREFLDAISVEDGSAGAVE